MLPQRREIASVVVCEDDATTLELLCDHLVADRFGVLPAPERLRRAAALPLQAAPTCCCST